MTNVSITGHKANGNLNTNRSAVKNYKKEKGDSDVTITYRFPMQFLAFRPPTLFMADQAVRATYGKEAA